MSLQRRQNNKMLDNGVLSTESSKRYAQRLESILARAVNDLRLGGASIYLLNETRNQLRAQITVDGVGRRIEVSDRAIAFAEGDELSRISLGCPTSTDAPGDVVDTAVPISVEDQVIGVLTARNGADRATDMNHIQSLGLVATEAAFVLDRRRAEERMAEEARHEHALFEVSKAISSALDPNHILELVAELMAKGIATNKSAVYVWERDLGQLRRRAAHGTFKKTDKKYSAIPFPPDSEITQSLSANQAVRLEDESSDALDHELRLAIDSSKAIVVPLMSKNRLVAVAIVGCPVEFDTFDQDEVDLLMAIAAQAAVSIENATLYEAQNRAVTELAALYAVSQALAASLNLNDGLQIVAESIAAVTGVTRCGVFLIEQGRAHGHLIIGVPEEEKRAFRGLKLGVSERETAMMQAIKDGKPTVVDGYASRKDSYLAQHWRIKRMLAVPLIFEGRTVGLAAADEPGHAATFSPNTIKVAAAIGEQAAIAIQNARLYEQTRKHAEELQVLWEAGQALGGELNLNDMLSTLLLQLKGLPHIQDVSIIVRHWDGSLFVSRNAGEPARFRNERALTDPCDLRTVGTMASHEAQIIRDIRKHPECPYTELASSESESCSALSIPLRQDKKTIGVLNIFATADREFDTGEIRLFGSLASLAAAAIARAQTFERERRIAETFQRSFLPDVSDRYGEYEIARQYAAALEEARIGGDFYDVFHVGQDKLALVIGDVSGKGLNAAVHTATAKYLIRAFAFEECDPGRVLSRANDALCFYVPESMFVTLFMAVLDTSTDTVCYANAGHELPMMWSNTSARFRSLACTGRALGFMANCQYLTEQITFERGDVLLMYTDGITEARKDGKFFDTRGVREAAEPIIHATAAQVAESIESEVRNYTGGKLRDDIALLVVKRQG